MKGARRSAPRSADTDHINLTQDLINHAWLLSRPPMPLYSVAQPDLRLGPEPERIDNH